MTWGRLSTHCCALAKVEFDVDAISALFLYREGTDLRRVLAMERGHAVLGPAQKLGIALGIARGLAFVHRKGWAHCDIKPENILICDADSPAASKVLIADFGFAQPPPATGLTKRRGSPGFIAPEIRTCSDVEGYDGRIADMWSAGLTILELFLGCERFDGEWLSNGPNRGSEDSHEIHRLTLKALRAVKLSLCPPFIDSDVAQGEEKDQNTVDAAWKSCVQRVFRRSIVLKPETRWNASELVECVRKHHQRTPTAKTK